MDTQLPATVRTSRARSVVLSFMLAVTALPLLSGGLLAQDATMEPAASPTASEAACQSADDLRVIVDFIGDSVESEAGLIPVGIGVIAGLSEARALLGLVGEAYRPLVEDLVLSLQDTRDSLGALGDGASAGERVAAIGESLVGIGEAMDELGTQLRTPCPQNA
jgi:hypothetical protein